MRSPPLWGLRTTTENQMAAAARSRFRPRALDKVRGRPCRQHMRRPWGLPLPSSRTNAALWVARAARFSGAIFDPGKSLGRCTEAAPTLAFAGEANGNHLNRHCVVTADRGCIGNPVSEAERATDADRMPPSLQSPGSTGGGSRRCDGRACPQAGHSASAVMHRNAGGSSQ